MTNLHRIFALAFLWFLCVPVIYDASAHSMFNSETEKIGGYKMQIATLPEIPNQDEKFQLLFRALDNDDKELEKFRMGVRIYYNDLLVDYIPPQVHTNGHWETDYVVLEAMDEYESQVDQSNTNNKHILLYLTQDLGFSIDPHTHTYNMADVTKLISDQGAISSTVIGGVKAFECQADGELEGSFTTVDWREELSLNDNGLIAGEIYNVTWEPKVLSGAGMGGHWYDGFRYVSPDI